MVLAARGEGAAAQVTGFAQCMESLRQACGASGAQAPTGPPVIWYAATDCGGADCRALLNAMPVRPQHFQPVLDVLPDICRAELEATCQSPRLSSSVSCLLLTSSLFGGMPSTAPPAGRPRKKRAEGRVAVVPGPGRGEEVLGARNEDLTANSRNLRARCHPELGPMAFVNWKGATSHDSCSQEQVLPRSGRSSRCFCVCVPDHGDNGAQRRSTCDAPSQGEDGALQYPR